MVSDYYYYIYIALIEFAIMLTIYSTLLFGSGLLAVLCHRDLRRSHPFRNQLPRQYAGLQATHSAQ